MNYVCTMISLSLPHSENQASKWAKSPKNSLKECVFANSALKIQCQIVKNTLLQIGFCFSIMYFIGQVKMFYVCVL